MGADQRILVVDDEMAIVNTQVLILNQQGFAAKAAYSGEQAIEEAGRWKPDVLIADVFLGGMTGIDAATQIADIVPRCKIVLISGQPATMELLNSALSRGQRFDILAKPLHPIELIEHLNKLKLIP